MAPGISSAIYTREMADLSGFRQHQVKTKTRIQRKRERTEDFEQTCYVVPDTVKRCGTGEQRRSTRRRVNFVNRGSLARVDASHEQINELAGA